MTIFRVRLMVDKCIVVSCTTTNCCQHSIASVVIESVAIAVLLNTQTC